MNRARPLLPDRITMGLGRIPLMPRKAVTWIASIHLFHQQVPIGLGQDRSRPDDMAKGVALDNPLLGHADSGDGAGIHQNVIGTGAQPLHRPAHGGQNPDF